MPDPFFQEVHDGQWNALVGRQGDELNYVDGYIEAAQILAAAIIDGSLYGKRDTLILPILYNARHAIELVLKFAINQLHAIGAIASTHAIGHDIRSHWRRLRDANVGDLTIRMLVEMLAAYVESLANVDEHGQELRYATTRDDVTSLAAHATVNIQLVRDSLDGLSNAIKDLVNRVSEISAEQTTKTFTRECSRRDLKEIAVTMGPRAAWTEDDFLRRRAEVCARFRLSNGKFSNAIDAILASRELAAIVGVEADLRYLSDDKAVAAMTAWTAWRDLPRARANRRPSQPVTVQFGDLVDEAGRSRDFDVAIRDLLSVEELADIGTLFELGLLRGFGERYEEVLAETVGRFRAGRGLEAAIPYLMQKTNLKECVIAGARIAGRPGLSEKLAAIEAKAS